MKYKVIVIGGGPAGVTAALRAAELGASVALVERSRLGGTCTNDGCVPTRVLAKAARLRRDAEFFDIYGLEGSLPQVNFERLLRRTQNVVYRMHEKKQLEDHLQDSGVAVFTEAGRVSFWDQHSLTLQDGGRLEGEKFILCPGGHARRLEFPGSQFTLTHHDVWSLKELPRSVAIIGAAATGCQLATIFSALGSQVHMLDVSPRILAAEDSLVSMTMHDAFLQRGIAVLTGIQNVEQVQEVEEGLCLTYHHQESELHLTVAAVVQAVGWVGNTEQLNLEAAGVQTKRSYVVVDDRMRTSAENIYAAGDVTGRMMLVQSGSYEGRIAAENAVLGPGASHKHQIVPHGGFTDPEYASVGLTEEQARQVEPDCLAAVVPYADLDRAVIDGLTEGFCKLVVSRENHRILGAHVVGEQALEVVQMVAAGMAADMWVEQLADLELAYPTYSSIVGRAARRVVRELGVMPLAPLWHVLGKPHAAEWERSSR